MAIEIVKEKQSKKKQDPYYILTYNYMIGDANGYTDEEVTLSADNPFIERYVTILNKLSPTKGHWGVMLSRGRMLAHHEEGQITSEEYNFLMRTAFEEDLDEEDELFKTEQENEWANEFSDGVRAEAEYSFLVFEGVDLEYVDEYGKKHKTQITA
jgi:hypothetical protein